MARARNIKPSFFKNEDLAELPFSTRLLFIGLWMLADREGRLEDRPKRIRMEVFPGDDVNVEKGLADLHASGFINQYEADGSRYIEVCAFLKHQNPHFREPASIIPKPEACPQFQLGLSPRLDTDSMPPKPEALPALKGGSASQLKGGSAGLNPSFLNPESPSLIPESRIPSKSKASPGNGSGAKDPLVDKSAKPVDPVKDEIWKSGRAILESQGDSREGAGSFLGKLCKDFGQVLVLDAVRDCAKTTPAEAKAWLTARCQERRSQSGNKQEQLEARNRAVAQRALEEARGGAKV